MNKSHIKSISINMVGAFILGIGCTLFLSANIGSDALTTFSQGISETSHISFSICYYGLNLLMMFIALFMNKKQVGLGTIVFPAVSAITIQLSSYMLPLFQGWVRYPAFFLGLFLLAFGIAFASKSDWGKNPYDAMNFAIMEKIDKDYGIIRSVTDALMLIVGILLGGAWGLGTVFTVLFTGVLASFLMKFLDKLGL